MSDQLTPIQGAQRESPGAGPAQVAEHSSWASPLPSCPSCSRPGERSAECRSEAQYQLEHPLAKRKQVVWP